MDSQITSKINNLQRELKELELREASISSELELVQTKIKAIKKEISDITENDSITKDILERVYQQRRRSDK